jgi:DNA-binding XRE family transcriptional regulator
MGSQDAGEEVQADAPGTDEIGSENGAAWYMFRCKTLRESLGMRKQTLAKEAGVDRATIDKIEKRKPVTRPIAFRVFNAIQARRVEKLDSDKEITNTTRKKA